MEVGMPRGTEPLWCLAGAPRKEVYFMAIIDILTPYDTKKKAAHAAKTVKHGVSLAWAGWALGVLLCTISWGLLVPPGTDLLPGRKFSRASALPWCLLRVRGSLWLG